MTRYDDRNRARVDEETIRTGSHRAKAIFRTVRHSSSSTRFAASRPLSRVN